MDMQHILVLEIRWHLIFILNYTDGWGLLIPSLKNKYNKKIIRVAHLA